MFPPFTCAMWIQVAKEAICCCSSYRFFCIGAKTTSQGWDFSIYSMHTLFTYSRKTNIPFEQMRTFKYLKKIFLNVSFFYYKIISRILNIKKRILIFCLYLWHFQCNCVSFTLATVDHSGGNITLRRMASWLCCRWWWYGMDGDSGVVYCRVYQSVNQIESCLLFVLYRGMGE